MYAWLYVAYSIKCFYSVRITYSFQCSNTGWHQKIVTTEYIWTCIIINLFALRVIVA